MVRGRGYEYRYRFTAEDEILLHYPSQVRLITYFRKGFVLEIRTCFKLKSRVCDGDTKTMALGSERFAESVFNDGDESWLQSLLNFRLQTDYWMSDSEILTLARDALDFARYTAARRPRAAVIAVAVSLDVWTVQREAEPIKAAMDRAIAVENLIPIHVWPVAPRRMVELSESAYELYHHFLWTLPRQRVEEDEGRVGEVCGVCAREFVVGAQMSFLPDCSHVFHSHCVFKWLQMRMYSCPSCQLPIPSDLERNYLI